MTPENDHIDDMPDMEFETGYVRLVTLEMEGIEVLGSAVRHAIE